MATLRPAALAVLLGTVFCALSCGSKSIVDQVCPTNPQRMATSSQMTPAEFCQVYMQTCSGANAPPNSPITEPECESEYMGLMFDSTRECRSYHVCNAASYDSGMPLLHCRHAFGLDLCGDTGP